MNLLYCHMEKGNFGDDINEWFWDRLAPGLIDNKGDDTLFGIGTILQSYYSDRLNVADRKFVLGAGAGSKGPLPVLDSSWKIYGVRGPLTATYFELSNDMVVGDPAIMIGRMADLLSTGSRSGVGFMPHVWTTEAWDWRPICDRLGIEFVDPTADSRETIKKISSLEKLLTEAMHGAIVADAVRTPWVAVVLSPRFEPSKWCDWAGSLGIDLHFRQLPYLRGGHLGAFGRLRSVAKTLAFEFGSPLKFLDAMASTKLEVALAEQTLADIAGRAPTQLSDSARLERLMDKFQRELNRLCHDVLATSASPR